MGLGGSRWAEEGDVLIWVMHICSVALLFCTRAWVCVLSGLVGVDDR